MAQSEINLSWGNLDGSWGGVGLFFLLNIGGGGGGGGSCTISWASPTVNKTTTTQGQVYIKLTQVSEVGHCDSLIVSIVPLSGSTTNSIRTFW